MSSITNAQSESLDHDELVAYLDGELAPESCRAVEERLANDAEYRQQLRDLDQAWEALNVLPTTAVDDGFARTTIELACVVAEEDLSQRAKLAAVENRSRKRWWVAGAVTAVLVGFVMMRALATHRNNLQLSDLPVIGQVNTLPYVSDLDFLRQLSAAQLDNELIKDNTAFDRSVNDLTKASASNVGERREWVETLTPGQKADLADRYRAFEELRQNPERERLRKLSNDINDVQDSAKLQKTLVAYGQWLSRHTLGEQEQLRTDFQNLSPAKQVETIKKMVRREDQQAAHQLSQADIDALCHEIFALAKERKAAILARLPADSPNRVRISNIETNNAGLAHYLLRDAIRSDGNSEVTVDRLMNKMSKEANDHWRNLPRWQRDKRWKQFWEWIHQAMQTQTQWGPTDLQKFFVESLSNDKKAELLNMPRAKMDAELERLYLQSKLKIDDHWQLMRDFGDPGHGPRNGPRGPGQTDRVRPGMGPDRRPDGPPPGETFGPDGPQRERFDRERPPGPGGPRNFRPEDQREGRRSRRPSTDPGEGAPTAEEKQPLR